MKWTVQKGEGKKPTLVFDSTVQSKTCFILSITEAFFLTFACFDLYTHSDVTPM